MIPMRTGRGQNGREHHYERARRVKGERQAVAWAFACARIRPPALPVRVTLSRCAPSNGLDDDNLSGSLKGVRDEVAKWLGVDDADPRVKFAYDQRRAPWAVEINIAVLEVTP